MSEWQLLASVRRHPDPTALARRVQADLLFPGLRRLRARGLVTRRRGLYRLTRLGVHEYELQSALARLAGPAQRREVASRPVDELALGLWHWKAVHPEWRESEPWDRNVSSYAVDDGERLLLFDPLDPPDELEKLAAERQTAIVLTAPWHERDSQGLVERLGVPVYTPLPDSAEYLMQKYGITAEQAGDGSPDVVWLLKEGKGEAHPYAAGDRLDVGVEAFPGQKPNDLVLWVESKRVVVVGDTLPDFGDGLHVNPRWLDPDMTREQIVEGLRPLLEKPIEHVLATHGGPYDRAALERALA